MLSKMKFAFGGKKLFAIIISLAIILVFLILGFLTLSWISKIYPQTGEPRVTQGQLYFADFGSKKELKKWETMDAAGASANSSKWEISSGALIQKSNIYKKDSVNAGSFLVLKNDKDWQNYQVTLKFKPTNEGGVGFLVRYQDENNFYKISLVYNKDLGGPYIRIDKVKDGKVTKLYQVKKSYKLGQENEAKIIVKEKRIDFYLNSDKVTIYGLDKGEAIDRGGFGFLVFDMPDISFDNLEIVEIKSESSQSEQGQISGTKTEEKKIDEEIDVLLEEIGIE